MAYAAEPDAIAASSASEALSSSAAAVSSPVALRMAGDKPQPLTLSHS